MGTDRRALARRVRDATPDAGIYAVHVGERTWVGAAMQLGAAENRLRFTLRTGSVRTPGMGLAYAETGEMRFEVLERLDKDLGPMTRERLLKEKAPEWCARLRATPL